MPLALRLGVCCIFREQPIQFKQTTAKSLARLPRKGQLLRLSHLCLHNLKNLEKALQWLISSDIRAFRILSPLFPRYTHPDVGYTLEHLPDFQEITTVCSAIRKLRDRHDLRLSLHPDQFNVLSTADPDVLRRTLLELEYQGLLAELVGAEVITVHGGGAYGDKRAALSRFVSAAGRLSTRVLSRLALENDDITYTPEDLLPVCRELAIPFVYDVHHHRCLPDGLPIETATHECLLSWQKRGREPYFHISSPKNGWQSPQPRPHADYIDPLDIPPAWLTLSATVDVEAKAKELAVLRLHRELSALAPRRQ